MSIYDKLNDARLPPIGKQVELTDKTFLVLDLERFDATDDDHRPYYVADILADGTEAKYYLAGTVVMTLLDLVASNPSDLPVAFRQVRKRTRSGGTMYDLIEPEAGEIKALMAAHRKLTVVEKAS